MGHPGVEFARKGGLRGALLGGGVGATTGAVLGATAKNRVTGEKRTKKQRILGGILAGGIMGTQGAVLGHDLGFNMRARKWNAGFRPAPPRPDWMGKAKTKAEARRAYHAQARKLHPDLHGGSPEPLKNLNKEWEEHEPTFKTAMYAAFADELEKIASVGALIGGYAGHRMSGKDLKSQAMGIAGGALAGHLMGKGLGAAKREIIDRPAERERAELYGYQSPPPPTNF